MKSLAIVRIENREYFVDLRLGQFRRVDNPHEYVDFDTEEGEALLEHVPLARCSDCGFRAIISSTDKDLYCMRCKGRVWMI